MMKHRPKCRLLLKMESHRRRHDTNACRKHRKKHMFLVCHCRRALSKISTHRKTQYCPARPTWTCQKRKMIVFDSVCSDRHTTPMAAESCDNAPRRIDNRLAMYHHSCRRLRFFFQHFHRFVQRHDLAFASPQSPQRDGVLFGFAFAEGGDNRRFCR